MVHRAPYRPLLLSGCLVLICQLLPGLSSAQQSDLYDAVTYKELQRRGGKSPFERPIETGGRAYVGIDINSSVEIEIDSPTLFDAVLPHASGKPLTPAHRDLVVQLRLLTEAIRTIDPALKSVTNLLGAYALGEQSGNYDPFFDAYNGTRELMKNLQDTLVQATERRLLNAGISASLSERAAKEELNPIYEGDQVAGYNWDALGKLYEREIRHVEDALRAVAPHLGLKLEIRAHRVRGSKEAVAIYLPNYNTVETGEESFYRKVRFEIPPEQAELHKQYVEMAKAMEETQNLGDAMLQSLQSELDLRRDEIEALFASAKDALEVARNDVVDLAVWTDDEVRSAWIDSVRTDLEQTDAGREVLERWQAFQHVHAEILEDVDALETYAELHETIAGSASSEEALNQVLSSLQSVRAGVLIPDAAGARALRPRTWTARAKVVDDLLSSLRGITGPLAERVTAEDGPVGDLTEAATSIRAVFDELDKATAGARIWLVQALGLAPAEFAATLPEPEGQKALGLAPEEDLSTSFNLRTINEGREPDDRIRVEYRFFEGDEELQNLRWTDEFVVRVYGWQDNVAAGIAFTRRTGESKWQPTANLSWLLKHRRWPSKEKDDGLGGLGGFEWFSGFGLSTMPLSFDENESVELGLAFTLSFLENRLIGGYGTNLQADTHRTYWWLSIRLFDSPGVTKKGRPTE